MSTYAAHIFVDARGQVYGAKDTVTRSQHTLDCGAIVRTAKNGNMVVSAGHWYGSQMSYRPFLAACDSAQKIAIANK